jgi:Lrp/AsnC family leucine-responsive transcriptional regulator
VLDEIDRALLAALQRDGQISYADLGAAVGLSSSAINDRLKRLKARGVLRRISAEVAPEALGLELLAFLLVELGDFRQEKAFQAAMRERPEVLECHHMAGEYSYLLKLRLSGTSHLEQFLNERLKPLPGVQRTHSLIVLSTVKEIHQLDTTQRPEPES